MFLDRRVGGVSIFVLRSFHTASVLESPECETRNFLVMRLDRLKVRIADIYRPPTANLTSFLQKLDVIMVKHPEMFVFGDFNINLFGLNANNVNNYNNVIEYSIQDS
jgi:hypothetical protein